MLQAPNFKQDVTDGLSDAGPVLIAVLPFSAVYGAVAIDHGLSLFQVLLSSLTIYAVASQYVMVDLLGQETPAWAVILSVFAVNFRHVLYSASIGQHLHRFSKAQKALAFFTLVDPQYAASEARASDSELHPAYYFSYAAAVYTTWIAANLIGALFGKQIATIEHYGLDFILPLYFTALVFGFNKRRRFYPVLLISASTSILVYNSLGSPWHITLGGLAGLVFAAATSQPVQGESHA